MVVHANLSAVMVAQELELSQTGTFLRPPALPTAAWINKPDDERAAAH
jgi:hypothetical protein